MAGPVARPDDKESPGAGRAKLRLSRGFPRCFAQDVIPYNLVNQLTKEFMGGRVIRQDHAESPGSGGASPYPELRPTCPGATR